jgi:uncharacterized membrane protein YsdA (DUF1294 family)
LGLRGAAVLTRILLLVNFAVFLTVGLDKFMATHGKRRVPEARLLIAAALGCAPGLWLGMVFFRHKVKKASFLAWATLALASSIAIYVFAWYRA